MKTMDKKDCENCGSIENGSILKVDEHRRCVLCGRDTTYLIMSDLEKMLKDFPRLPKGYKPTKIYLDGNMIVGVVEGVDFMGFAKWDGVSVSYSEYKIHPKL